MFSKTRRTKAIRKNKRRTCGQKRKNALENKGTTPSDQEMFRIQEDDS